MLFSIFPFLEFIYYVSFNSHIYTYYFCFMSNTTLFRTC